MSHDYSEFQPTVRADSLATINQLVLQLQEAEVELAKAEESLKRKKARRDYLLEQAIPEAMDNAEQTEITTQSGYKVKVARKISASIPKARQQEAFDWLEANGFGRLIKQTFVVEFGKDDEQWAAKFARDCAQRKRPLHLSRNKGVHAQTLGAFVRGQMAEGIPVPKDILGIFDRRVADVKPVKEK